VCTQCSRKSDNTVYPVELILKIIIIFELSVMMWHPKTSVLWIAPEICKLWRWGTFRIHESLGNSWNATRNVAIFKCFWQKTEINTNLFHFAIIQNVMLKENVMQQIRNVICNLLSGKSVFALCFHRIQVINEGISIRPFVFF